MYNRVHCDTLRCDLFDRYELRLIALMSTMLTGNLCYTLTAHSCFVAAVSLARGSSQPNQAQAHEQEHTEDARQLSQQLPQRQQQQQRQSGGNRWNRTNERQNEVKQQRDGGHADGFHRQVPTANKPDTGTWDSRVNAHLLAPLLMTLAI